MDETLRARSHATGLGQRLGYGGVRSVWIAGSRSSHRCCGGWRRSVRDHDVDGRTYVYHPTEPRDGCRQGREASATVRSRRSSSAWWTARCSMSGNYGSLRTRSRRQSEERSDVSAAAWRCGRARRRCLARPEAFARAKPARQMTATVVPPASLSMPVLMRFVTVTTPVGPPPRRGLVSAAPSLLPLEAIRSLEAIHSPAGPARPQRPRPEESSVTASGSDAISGAFDGG